jgi:hypothetical protein
MQKLTESWAGCHKCASVNALPIDSLTPRALCMLQKRKECTHRSSGQVLDPGMLQLNPVHNPQVCLVNQFAWFKLAPFIQNDLISSPLASTSVQR